MYTPAESDTFNEGVWICCEKHRDHQHKPQHQPVSQSASLQVTFHQVPPMPRDGGKQATAQVMTNERREAEWRMVAYFADRLFFWVFLAMSAAVQTTIFVNMVPGDHSV